MQKELDNDMNGQDRHRVLMISHAFPPMGGSGVQRTAKFAKYLPQFGWTPIVWASADNHGLPIDESLMNDLPAGLRVIRHQERGFDRQVRRMVTSASAVQGGGLRRMAANLATAIDWRLQAWRRNAPFPDDCAAWANDSLAPLRNLIRHERIEAIYSTFSPVSNHALAMSLAQETRLPWIADFRDLWTDDPRYTEAIPQRRVAARNLEQRILEAADAVIGVSPQQARILNGRVPGLPSKFTTITNGFDPADLALAAPLAKRDDERFVISHVGRLDVARTRPELFAGLAEFARQSNAPDVRLLLRVVGHCSRETIARLKGAGIDLECTGYVSHAEAIREMHQANVLLALLPTGRNAESIICGKLFEYLATGNPVLVVGPNGGECERIVQDCEGGLAVGFDARAISSALTQLQSASARGRRVGVASAETLASYSRIETTRELASILNRLVGAQGDGACDATPELAGVS